MRSIGDAARGEMRVYFAGGATAVLEGWRDSTLDVDLKMVPDRDEVFRAIPRLKDQLLLNVELASPADFIPVRDGWEDRSPFIAREGRVGFHHFELCAQALSKIERGHTRDLEDAAAMVARNLVTTSQLAEYFGAIEPSLYRYPAVDSVAFRRKLDRFLKEHRAA